MNSIKNFCFHNKVVKDINIKSNKDFMDEIIISFLEGNDKIIELKCMDCVICNIVGRGWITGKDSIYEWIFKEGEEIKDLIPSFIEDEHKKEFKYLMLNFNTTNTTIEIVAKKIFIT